MIVIKKLSKILIVVALLTALPLGVLAHEKEIDYVALGDSLAAGYTPDYGIDMGYPEYLAKRFEQSQYTVDLKNFGVGGYTSHHLLGDIIYNPTVQAAIREAELVTIDIGANDLLGALRVNPALVGSALQSVTINIHTILMTIDQLNPNAKVYVMGYYNPFPHWPMEQQVMFLPLLDTLNSIIQSAAVSNGDTFVPTEKVIAKKHVKYLTNPTDIHLSKEGYQVLAKEFWKAIDSE